MSIKGHEVTNFVYQYNESTEQIEKHATHFRKKGEEVYDEFDDEEEDSEDGLV